MRLQGLALMRARPAVPALSDPEFAPARILLRAPNHLGDAIMAEPAARAIAGRFSAAEVDVQITAPLAPLIEAWPFPHRALPLPPDGGLAGQWLRAAASRALAPAEYGLCVLFPNSFSAGLQAAQAGAQRILGYARDGREAFLTDAIASPPDPTQEHMTVYYGRLAAAFGDGPLAAARDAPRLQPTPAMRESADRLLAEHGLRDGSFIAVAPGAAYGPAKQWPAEHFAALCRALIQRTGLPIALLGTAAERPLCASIAEALPGDTANLAGRTDLGAMLGVLARAAGFVGNDSGAAHAAAALGKAGVAIFGSTSDRHTAPLGPRMRVVHLHLDCSPCFKRDCPLGHTNCLRGIPPDLVQRTLAEALHAT